MGGAQGQGGGGGTGEAPALNYDINSENFTMNLLLRDRCQPQNAFIGLLRSQPQSQSLKWPLKVAVTN